MNIEQAVLFSAINKLDEQIPQIHESWLNLAIIRESGVDAALNEKLAGSEIAESHVDNAYIHLALSKIKINRAKKALTDGDFESAILNYGQANGYFYSAKAVAYKNRVKKYPLIRGAQKKFEKNHKSIHQQVVEHYLKNKSSYIGKRGKPTKSSAYEKIAAEFNIAYKTAQKYLKNL